MKYFTIDELCASNAAERRGIKNTPSVEELVNLTNLINCLLDKVRDRFGKPIYISSGFRCTALNSAVGGVKGSQHQKGQAADIITSHTRVDLAGQKELFKLIYNSGIEYDQLIWEKGNDEGPAWIHISYNVKSNRRQALRTDDGKTYYAYKDKK